MRAGGDLGAESAFGGDAEASVDRGDRLRARDEERALSDERVVGATLSVGVGELASEEGAHRPRGRADPDLSSERLGWDAVADRDDDLFADRRTNLVRDFDDATSAIAPRPGFRVAKVEVEVEV